MKDNEVSERGNGARGRQRTSLAEHFADVLEVISIAIEADGLADVVILLWVQENIGNAAKSFNGGVQFALLTSNCIIILSVWMVLDGCKWRI